METTLTNKEYLKQVLLTFFFMFWWFKKSLRGDDNHKLLINSERVKNGWGMKSLNNSLFIN